MFCIRNWQATSTVLSTSSLRLPETLRMCRPNRRLLRKNWSSGGFSKSSKVPLKDQFRYCIISSRSMLAILVSCPTVPLLSNCEEWMSNALLTADWRTRFSGSFLRSDFTNWICGSRSMMSFFKYFL